MLAKGQITVSNIDDGKTPFLHQAYKMKDGRFLKHYPVYEASPINGYKEGDLWHKTDGSQPGYFVANKSNATLNLNDWTFYANELAYSDTDKFYPKFEGIYSDYNEVASDDQTKYTWKIIKADDGVGIKSVKEYYAISTSNVTPPSLQSDWSETPKATNTTNKYLWNYEVYTYSNGDVKETAKRVIGTHGTTGATGASGQSVTSITEEYYLSTSKTSQTGGSWKETPDPWTSGKYQWTRSKIVYTNPAKTEWTTPIVDSSWEAVNDYSDTLERQKYYKYKQDIVVYGESDKFYPVSFYSGDQSVKRDILITRSYSERAPEDWNSATHKGGLTLKIKTNFGGWGGANYSWEIHELEEMYSKLFAGAGNIAANMGFAVMLRGGGDGGAIYHIHSDQSLTGRSSNAASGGNLGPGPVVYYESDLLYYNAAQTYTWNAPAPIDFPLTAAQQREIDKRKFIQLAQEAVQSTDVEYYLSTSSTTPTGGTWATTAPPWVNGKFMWSRTKIVYGNGTTRYAPSTTGTCIAGATGNTGNGITSVTNRYLATTLATGVTTATSGWTTTVQKTDSVKKYLWNYEEILYTNGTKIPTTPVIIGTHGEKGDNSVTGLLTNESITLPANKDGLVPASGFTGAKGIFDVYDGTTKKTGSGVKYSLVSQSNITVTINATTGAYSVTAMPTGTTILNGYATLSAIYNGVTIEKQLSVSKSLTGATGASGKDGIAGKDGKGISSTTITYGLSTTDTVEPTSYTSNVPTLVKGRYLWTKTVWKYTDTTTETGYTKTYIAKDGNNGTDGIAGKDGVGIKSTSITYVGSTSGTVTPTSGWTTAVPTVASGSFLWTRTIWTYTDNTTETGYSVARMGSNGATGATGAPGASATSYWITASNNIIGKSQTGVINPTTITFKGFSKTGTANSVAYSGRFIVQTSTNGTTYTTRYTSSADQNTYTYTIPSDSLFVKCLFYMAGGTSVLLDEQTVPVVETAEGIQVGGENLISKNNTTYRHGTLTNTSSEKLTGSGKWFVDFLPNFEPNTTYTLSNSGIKNTGARGQVLNVLIYNGAIQTLVQRLPSMGSAGKSTFTTNSEVLPTDRLLVYISDGTTVADFEISKLKLEKGTVATDWTPAPEDARNYKAWANSADGGEDFTRVYPNENILIDTKFDGESWTGYQSPTISYPIENGTKNIKMVRTATGQQGIRTANTLDLEKGVQYTLSYQARGNLSTSQNFVMLSPAPNYHFHSDTGALTTTFKQFTQTFTVPTSLTGISVDILFTHSNGTGAVGEWLEIKGGTVKLERGTTPTVYTTNTADSLTGSVPKYVGFSPLDSNKPSDYEWIINPEWTEISSREYAESKIEQTSTDIMMSVTESFVGSEEFGTYIDSVGTQFQQTAKDFNFIFDDVKKSINGVAENVEKNYSEIQKYIRFEDGNIILGSSDSDSTLKITQNEIAFMQGGSKVAYFSGQSFYINKGILVESMQVGEHRMTRGSGGHTSFDWIG